MPWQKKSLIAVFFIFFLDNFGYAVIFPILSPLLLNPNYHFLPPEFTLAKKNLLLGLALTSFPVGQFFGAPIIGDLTDAIGRKKIFYITVSGTVLGLFISAISIHLSSYSLLLTSRFFTGFFAGNLGICMASIADLSPTEMSRAKNYGILAALAGVSWALAMITGGILSNPGISSMFSPALPFYITTILTLASLFVLHFLFYETHPIIKKISIDFFKELKNIVFIFKSREVSLVFLGTFFWYLSWFFTLMWTPAYVLQQFKASQLQLTYFLIGVGLIWTFGSSILNYLLLKKFDSIKVVLIGVFFLIISFFAMAPTRVFWIYVLLNLSVCMFGAFSWANLNNIISLAGTSDEQGRLMGINQSIIALTQIIAPALGALLTIIYPSLIYYAAGGSAVCAFLVILVAKRNFKKRSI